MHHKKLKTEKNSLENLIQHSGEEYEIDNNLILHKTRGKISKIAIYYS